MSNNTNLKLTIEAWADIVIKEWLNKITAMGLINTSALYNSFVHHIVASAGGDVQRIEFAFNYYGKFLDMGVGKGIKAGQHADSFRDPKKWYSPVLTYHLAQLRDILVEKYAMQGVSGIVEQINIKKA